MSNDRHIELLADHPEHIEAVARWCHDEWGFIRPGDTLEARMVRLRQRLGRDGVPVVYIAFVGTSLAGTASLVVHDLESRPELTPWLASLFVAPEHRRQGIGDALVRRVVDTAAGLGYPQLYLYTFDRERYYAGRGWRTLDSGEAAGRPITVMSTPAGDRS